MRICLALAVALIVGAATVGCSKTETSKTKVETTVKTPGGETTVTTEKTVEATGENPPAPATDPVPAPPNP